MKPLFILGHVSRIAASQGLAISEEDLHALEQVTEKAGVDADVLMACQDKATWGKKPSMKQIRAERERLVQEISASDATVIIALGPVAVQALWNKSGLKASDMHNQAYHLPDIKIPVHVTYSLEEAAMKPGLVSWMAVSTVQATRGEQPPNLGTYVRQWERHPDLRIGNVCAVDLETYPGTDPWHPNARIRMLSIAGEPGFAQVIQCTPDSGLPQWVKEILADPTIEKVGSNIRFDWRWLRRFGVEMNNFFCTANQQHLIDENLAAKDLKTLTLIYTDMGDYSLGNRRLTKQRGGWEHVTDDEMWEYAGADADASIRIHLCQMEKLTKLGLLKVRDMMKYYYRGISYLEAHGACVDMNTNAELDLLYREEIRALTERIQSHFGRPVNIKSPKQLVAALQELVHNIDLRGFFSKKEEDDKFSTRRAVLQREARKHPVIADILQVRRRIALHNFVKAVPKVVTTKAGRTFVHSSLRSDKAVTYRHSSSNLNLQNLPRNAEEEVDKGLNVKRQYVSRFDGGCILEADESQLELRVTAIAAADEALTKAFLSGEDVHVSLAAMMHGCPSENVTKTMRQDSKTTNFHVLYGGKAFGLSLRLGCTKAHAQGLIDLFDETFTGFVAWRAQQEALAKEYLEVTSLAGFPRRFVRPPSWSSPAGRRILRQAVNAPIQNVAGIITVICITQIVDIFRELGLKSVPFLTVHDSLMVDVYPGELETVARIVKYEMEHPATCWGIPLTLPLTADIKVGYNWGSLEEYSIPAEVV